jgi:hypothetical protein
MMFVSLPFSAFIVADIMIVYMKTPHGRLVAIQSQSSLVATVMLILLNRVVVAVQTIDGQDLAPAEWPKLPQLVHQLGMVKITVPQTAGSVPLMDMHASDHQPELSCIYCLLLPFETATHRMISNYEYSI